MINDLDLSDLPQEVLNQLTSTRLAEENRLVLLIRRRGGTASVDQMIIDLYREDKKVTKRTTIKARLWRLEKNGLLKREGPRDIYSLPGNNYVHE